MKKITLIQFLIFISTSLFGQQGVSVQSTVDKNQILIGDVVTYSVTVSHADSFELQMPSPAAALGMFEIRDYEVLEPIREDQQIVEQTTFLLSTFDTGEFEIPEVPIQYRSVGDSTWETIFSESILINVASLNPDSTGDIRDIKPPMTPPRDYRAMIQWIVFGLLGILLIAFVLYYIKRRREGKSLLPTRAQPPRPAHDIALDALDALVESELLKNGEIKEYYSRLSDIVRQYIEDRYFIPALEMTTTQLLHSMNDAHLLDEHIDITADFLATCDLVKFATFRPDVETHQQKTKAAYDFVNATKLIILDSSEDEAVESSRTEVPVDDEESDKAVVVEEKKKEEDGDV